MKNCMKFTALLLIPLTFLSCSGGEVGDSDEYVDSITNVEFYQVNPLRFEEMLKLPIVISPNREVNLGVPNGGRVTRINVDKGDRVKEGQVLLATDRTILSAALDNAEATLELQKKEFARYNKLHSEENISDADFDAVKHAMRQAESAYTIAKKNFDDATLEASFDGIVTTRNVEVGDMLSPGAPAFRVIDMSTVKVQAGIPERYIRDFETGDKVRITIDAIPGRTFDGTISYISPEASPSVRTFLAEITIDNRDGMFKAGTMGNAEIVRNVYEEALMVPVNAIIETQKGHVIFVLKDGDIVEERSLSILGGNDLMAHVEGISAGEKVITKGNYDLIDGEKVNVTGEYEYAGAEEES